MKKKIKVLSLSFFNDVWQHSYPEFKFLETLDKKKINVDYLFCNKDFSFCPAMDNKHVKHFETKKIEKVCSSCIKYTEFYKKKTNFQSYYIKDFFSKDDHDEIKKILQKINQKNFLKFKFRNIKVGKYALFNLILTYKLSSPVLNGNIFKFYKQDLYNCMKAIIVFEKCIKKNNYDYVFAYSTQYSLNRVCVEMANKYGIKVRSICGGKQTISKYNFLKIAEGLNQGPYYHAINNWKYFKKFDITYESFENFIEYLDSAINSKFFTNYSKKFEGKNIKKILKIKQKKIILIALSSMDERVADFFSEFEESKEKKCESKVFKTDLDWLKFLKNIFRSNPNIHFIVRLHPRDFPNKRNNQQAKYVKEIMEIKRNYQTTNNVTFDLPKDNISIYDYIPYIDLLLHSSSGLSYELGLFGIPSMTYDKNLYRFENDLTYFVDNINDYEKKMKSLIYNKNINKKKIILNSFRWLLYQLNYESLDISEIFPININSKSNKIILKIIKYFDPLYHIKYFHFKSKPLKNSKIINKFIERGYKSFYDYYLENKKFNVKKLSADESKNFSIVKNLMIKNLNTKLKKFYEKIN